MKAELHAERWKEKRTKRERKKDARGKADSNVEFADKERGRI